MPEEFTHVDDLHNDEDDNLTLEEIAAQEAAAAEEANAGGGEETDEERQAREAAEAASAAEGNQETDEEREAREALEAEAEAAGKTVEELQDEKTAAEEAEAAPGIEQFLAQYGISGGIITFEADEEGSEAISKHFDELSPNEQFTVLSELATAGAPSMESKYGLDENEIGLLNYVRQYDGSVEEALNDMAQKRVDQIMTVQDASNVDFNSMSDDAVVTKWLKENNPEASEEDIVAELERSKESKFYESQAKTMRENFIREQVFKAEEDRAAYESEIEAEREEDRAAIATAAVEIQDVAGFVIDDAGKNEVLGKILEVNDYGDSLFMQEVFSDPEKLFKAAWLYYNADSHLDELTKKHDRDLANEYKKGRDYATNGMPSTPVSGIGSKRTTENSKGERIEKTNDLSHLWENED